MKINVKFALPVVTPIYVKNRAYEITIRWLSSDNIFSINYIEQKLK